MPPGEATAHGNDRPPLDKGGLQGGWPGTLNPFLRRSGTTASFVFGINALTRMVVIHSVLWPMLRDATRP
jgi:hypothetical protein